MNIQQGLKFYFLLFIQLSLLSCQILPSSLQNQNPQFEELKISSEEFFVPPGDYPGSSYWSLVWARTGEIFLFIDIHDEIHYLTESGKFEHLGLEESRENCSRQVNYFNPEELPDGRIGWLLYCNSLDLPNVQGEEGVWRYLVAIDLETRQQEQIVPGKLPRVGTNKFSWNPTFTQGIVSAGNSSGTLFWVDEIGSSPIDLRLGSGTQSWNIKETYLFLDAEDNPLVGTANNGDWSADGRNIAFFASIESVGKLGFDRGESQSELYILDYASFDYEIVLSNVFYPSDLQWSPSNQNLAFAGIYGSVTNQQALWIYSLDQQKIYRVAEGDFRDTDWSPDGKSIVAIQCFETLCTEPKIIIFNIEDF